MALLAVKLSWVERLQIAQHQIPPFASCSAFSIMYIISFLSGCFCVIAPGLLQIDHDEDK